MILVTGATGNVGGEVVRALAADGQPVRALSRTPAAGSWPAGTEPVTGDLNHPDRLDGVLAGVDAVFLLAGYPDAPGLLARMKAAGVSRVVLLSTGAVEHGSLDNYVVRFNVVSEAAVRDSGLAWTVLRPSGFMANALRWRPQLAAGDTVREPFADIPVAVIDPADIGAAAALALTGSGHDGHSYRLTGPQTLLPAERVAGLGDVLGRELRFEGLPDAEAHRRMSERMPVAIVDAFFEFSRGGTYRDDQVGDTAPALLGRPLRTFRDWAQAHRDAFR
jgi:uncharacterized protein YbjT (DUF2867 family)